MPKLNDPQLNVAISGRHSVTTRARSSTVAPTPPPVVGLDDRVAALADPGEDLAEQPDVGHGPSRLRLAHVDVDDRRAGRVGGHGGVDDLVRRDGDRRALAGHAHPAA